MAGVYHPLNKVHAVTESSNYKWHVGWIGWLCGEVQLARNRRGPPETNDRDIKFIRQGQGTFTIEKIHCSCIKVSGPQVCEYILSGQVVTC